MARRFIRGEEGTRILLEGLPYSQVPDVALTLSGTAFKILGRLQRLAGHGSSCEVENQDLAQWVRRCTGTVQRSLVELEGANLISRRRRGGRRRIMLLYTLAGREASQAREALNALSARGQPSEATSGTSALSASAACNQRPGSMQSAPAPSPFEFEKEEEEQQEAGGSAAGVVASFSDSTEGRPSDIFAALAGSLAETFAARGAQKRPPAGLSPKNPRPAVVRDSVPDEPKCTDNRHKSQEVSSRTQHKNDYRRSRDNESERR